MKVICIGNYPPRQCGIATFTQNLVTSILRAAEISHQHIELEVIAMNDPGQSYAYPPIVTRQISDQSPADYTTAASYINESSAEVLLVQHEYGIFGGNSGIFLLGLLRQVRIPVVCTFHTVLEKPSFHQYEVLHRLGQYAQKVVIMNEIAIDFLVNIYQIPIEKIALIEHGTPDFDGLTNALTPSPAKWDKRKVMLTFGLIGRSKGIETVLRAMPEIVRQHPDILYVVLGKTHPHVLRNAGEEYRDYLWEMVTELQLEQHVVFVNKYVSEEELMAMLRSADIYVTPYLNRAQITSGTLCYAVSSGCAVFSTPYWHAETLLANDRGWLFDFGNDRQLASLINDALNHPDELDRRRQRARDYGKKIAWPEIGKSYLQLFESVAASVSATQARAAFTYPEFDISHLLRLTDETGLLQHANGMLPSYQHGYSLDDNARAMLVVITAYKHDPQQIYIDLLVRYFSFLRLMLQKNGQVKNYLSYDRKQFEEDYSDDAWGRSMWALGYLIRYAPNDALFQSAIETFQQMIPAIEHLTYARGYANAMFGIFHYIKRFPDQERFLARIGQVADILVLRFDQHQRSNWHWFEDALTYDNGIIPAAMYLAHSVTGKARYLEVAEKSRAFLEDKCFKNEWLSLIGNKRWLRFDSEYELYAQQPIDATAMMIMYKSAMLDRDDPEQQEKLMRCFHWFLGENDLNVAVYDHQTKGCNDGVENNTINRNQGAESLIAWLLAQLIARPFTHPKAL